MAKLKVFVTAIGFHDAYVAAPSRAAALRAWGADTNLFSAGLAEIVTNDKLIAAPLDAPGEVIKVSRGSAIEHLDELERTRPKKAPEKSGAILKKTPTPRPSCKKLEDAEAALAVADEGHRKSLDQIDRRIAKLRDKRAALDEKFGAEREKLERGAAEAERAYEVALEKWRIAG